MSDNTPAAGPAELSADVQGRRTPRTKAIVSAVVGGVVVLGAVGGYVIYNNREASSAVAVGDCIDIPGDNLADRKGTDVVPVGSVSVVDCGRPHDAEVYLIGEFPEMAYPGEVQAFVTVKMDMCLPEFEHRYGKWGDANPLDFFPLRPSESEWPSDRDFACTVHSDDGRVTGPIEAPAEVRSG